ncbi:MAG: glycoside hydrolase family 97 protein [Melioribacteraceae bacterium]|nr:glycoside hydrolase family 97 protein [Melioribacteraceae bacterium]
MEKFKLLMLFVLISSIVINGKQTHKVNSPDESISVDFCLSEDGYPSYTVSYSGNSILYKSKLGIVRYDENFSTGLQLDSVSNVESVKDSYQLLHGKRLKCEYKANKQIFYLSTLNSKFMNIIFQVSNDGVAFRYQFPEKSETVSKIIKEESSFHFHSSTKAFIQHSPDARTGWNYSQPSYEENYQINIPVGTPSPNQAGWVMPALFNYDKYWISITETAVDTNYCGSRLSQFSPDGEYSIQFPQPQEGRIGEPVLPESKLPWMTPWRVIVISDNLSGIVESTLENDLSIPAKYDVSEWLKPGVASWSWVILKDDSTIFRTQKRFIDFAFSMNWNYCLIDAMWDTQIGYDKIRELANYANAKNVKLLLWYNSAGDWNTTPLEPRNKLLTEESRKKEFKILKDIGIAGIKVDFFGGDGQSMIKYYSDILKDAADYQLAVNFHGSTYPRSWHRTYPNLVSMESIKGEEFVTFGQENADNQPSHCTIIPFTRNLFSPMDFTPVNLSGIPNIERRTTRGFELALSILFTSGIQHIAEIPEGMDKQDDFVKEFMSTLPKTWNDVKYIDGFPGKYVVLARKKDSSWFIAGINGENTERTIKIKAGDFSNSNNGMIITDSKNKPEMVQENIDLSKDISIVMQPNGGFVIRISND